MLSSRSSQDHISRTDKVEIYVNWCDLELDKDVFHPFVRITFMDISTGQLLAKDFPKDSGFLYRKEGYSI